MKNYLDPIRLGLAGGVLCGISLFILTLISLASGYGYEFIVVLAGIYPGYNISVSGSLVGFLYGFIDAFIGLFIFGWLYNLFGAKRQ